MKSRGRKGSRTSSFGVSKRESHDSSEFYARRLYDDATGEHFEFVENEIGGEFLDTVRCIDSRDMSLLPDDSVHLMVTSPPYNVGKDYDEDLGLKEYRRLLRDVCSEVHRKLVVGGRACVNVANPPTSPFTATSSPTCWRSGS